MANILVGNPLIIDTPGAGVLLTRQLDIQVIRWVGAAAGALATIQDQNGIEKWAGVAAAANYAKSNFIDFTIAGLIVPTLGSGKLYLYTR